MGAVGGGAWHFAKGSYNSPKGLTSKLQGGVSVCRPGSTPTVFTRVTLADCLRPAAPSCCPASVSDDVVWIWAAGDPFPSTGARRQLRSLGRAFLCLRLHARRREEEGGLPDFLWPRRQ